MALVLLTLLGCSTGGAGPAPISKDALYARGVQQLESVTTNLQMSPDTASTMLRAAIRDFESVLALEPDNIDAKMGRALANTFLGMFDLIQVVPRQARQPILDLVMDSGASRLTPIQAPLAQLARDTRANTSVGNVQMRIISRTLPGLRDALLAYDEVENAVRGGRVFTLRVYRDGQVRGITFGVADVQLMAAFGNLMAALMNLAVAYNLDMSTGVPTKTLPVDTNNNGMFDANEYLIKSPFLDKLYSQGTAYCLQYLRYAAEKAVQGGSLSGHTAGAGALVDVTDPEIQALLNSLVVNAELLKTATTAEVTTRDWFDDGVTRTYNLPKLVYIVNARDLPPSFQVDDLNALGVWPDPTFHGIVTPGVPQDFLGLNYRSVETAY